MAKEFEREIIEQYGIYGETSTGWTKEVNLVSWNGGEPKIDIRAWAPGYEKAAKGITVNITEARALAHILLEIEG